MAGVQQGYSGRSIRHGEMYVCTVQYRAREMIPKHSITQVGKERRYNILELKLENRLKILTSVAGRPL